MRHFSFFDGYDQKTQEILFEKLNHWLEERTGKKAKLCGFDPLPYPYKRWNYFKELISGSFIWEN